MRDINTLHPFLKSRADLLKARAAAELGLRVIITECLRTNDEQLALFSQGREQVDRTNALRKRVGWAPITIAESKYTVTNARTVADSWHGYGLAFDVAVTDATGRKIVWNNKSDWNNNNVDDWAEVGRLGIELGLEWGGNWTSRPDAPHFQYVFGHTIAKIKARPDVISGKTIMIPEYDQIIAAGIDFDPFTPIAKQLALVNALQTANA